MKNIFKVRQMKATKISTGLTYFYEQTLIPIKIWVEEILNDFILNIS